MSFKEIEKTAVTQEEADGWCAVQRKRGHRVDEEPWSAATPAPKEVGDRFTYVIGTCYASCDIRPHPSDRTTERCIVIDEYFEAEVVDAIQAHKQIKDDKLEPGSGLFVVNSFAGMRFEKFACRRLA
jgi:hypothetical protein